MIKSYHAVDTYSERFKDALIHINYKMKKIIAEQE